MSEKTSKELTKAKKRPIVEQSEDSGDESDDDDNNVVSNKFANDGSFLELFKKMQEQKQQLEMKGKQVDTDVVSTDSTKITESSKRKPKALKVGIIEKRTRNGADDNEPGTSEDNSAWNRYMREVRMYKDKYGDEEDKNRPLVK